MTDPGARRADHAVHRPRARGAVVAAATILLLAGSAAAPAVADPAVADPAAAHGAGGVTVNGTPLVHVFDLAVAGDAVTGEWEGVGGSPVAVPYDGVLATDGDLSDPLARALVVQYGETGPEGQVVAWHAAGTLAEPVAYGQAVARDPWVSADAPAVIPVRVSLPDPGAVGGEPGETHAVEASFTITYLDGTAADEVGSGIPSGPVGDLAVTGTTPWVGLLAAALVAAGVALRRRAHPARRPAPSPDAASAP